MTGADFIILVDCLGKFTHPELIDEISSDVTDTWQYINGNKIYLELWFFWYDLIISRDLR